MDYLVFDKKTGAINGAYCQALHPSHADCYIEVSPDVRATWTQYRYDTAQKSIVLRGVTADDIEAARQIKRDQITAARDAANNSFFTFSGKQIACDETSHYDISSVAEAITLTGSLPVDFPGAWKALDNTFLPIPDVATFKAMHSAMIAQGIANYKKMQELKAQLAAAKTINDIQQINW